MAKHNFNHEIPHFVKIRNHYMCYNKTERARDIYHLLLSKLFFNNQQKNDIHQFLG